MTNRQPTCISLQQKRCVYCQQAFEPGERSLAVLGSSGYIGFTEVFEMPSIGLMNQQHALIHFTQRDAAPQRAALCLRPACRSCTSSPSSYLAHKDCLDIHTNIVPGKATCDELWRIGIAVKPWFTSPGEEAVFKPAKGELAVLAPSLHDDGSGTKELVRNLLDLPDELFRMIMWEMADCSTLARLALISQFAAQILNELKCKRPLTNLDFTSVHLHMYKFISLGVQYEQFFKGVQSITDRSVLRLGLNHLGIRKMEILEDYPTARSRKTCAWYVLERLSWARTQLRIVPNGPFLRVVGRGHEKVQLWNIMNPPRPGSYYSVGRYSTSPRRTVCIDMRDVTAFTVFCDTRSVFGIHAHCADETAMKTYRNLYSTFQHTAMWRYFPLKPGEGITRAWVRRNSGLTHGTILAIYTSCDRRCYFGASSEREEAPHQILCDAPMRQLLHDEPALAAPISWFAATPKLSSPSQMNLEDDGNDHDLHHTRASLMHVLQAEIYSDDQGASTGVLFKYLNGSSECLGQRRMGLSTTKVAKANHPNRIYFRNYEMRTCDHRMLPCKRQCVEVRFALGDADLRSREWESQDMVGFAIWSFTLRKDIFQLSAGL
ncbi:hypothetical protein BKA65DRAFT_91431 [Rhexocercosporidium sp. MPI-PUGE-AT-0058]|nr:hypothetical protein BKA65DRAFT_91431 [Rhexocercosporidium sp. MPI-PUGE-AT-0058]